jgi:holo-[acyl-carrier protein] synthase
MSPATPRIGVDVVEIDRLAEQMERTSAFAERIFTPGERQYCERRRRRRYTHYAARFAAKEAVFKALGTGWSGDLCWTDVEVVPGPLGAPRLRLHGAARRLAETAGVLDAALSLSHSRHVAVAMVLLAVAAGSSSGLTGGAGI